MPQRFAPFRLVCCRLLARRALPCGLALLAACAAPPPAVQDVQRFYPGGDQLFSRSARVLREDGTPERHGVCESFTPDGQPRSREGFSHGVPDGEFQCWHPGGVPAVRGRYAAGLRTGEWCAWDEQGVLRERSTWRDGLLDGEAGAWDAQGHPAWSGHFAHDRRDGTFTAFHPNGQARVRGAFDAGRPAGRFTAWYADGTRAGEGRYADGAPVGTWICWNTRGEVLASQSLRGAVAGARPAFDGEPALAPAADPFDLAAVFVERPSADAPVLAQVVMPAPVKPAPAPLASRAAPAAGEARKDAPAHVGVN
ncbi:MAG TPA: hypothetical protein VK824_08660 [Planctomycetota bacterium]|nr:hypothetical protein [Planctomycetota bacterium]